MLKIGIFHRCSFDELKTTRHPSRVYTVEQRVGDSRSGRDHDSK
jgi:hypothetical protein